ncbi:MAG TPA: N-acetylmuramoyl-L-alanine amidase [Candidatus Nitrosotenuis sp.]|jgi:N-acetylmuramoyl-L-alanine amidase|nr:N-acetylmuramoyl-L-alanine amidase [Candidatus Nitrosotenuis sp.]
MKNTIKYTPSMNYNTRKMGAKPKVIIIHYTNMTNATSALSLLCNPQSQVSAHYLIEKFGTIHQLVPDHFRAWHAGLSSWQGIDDLNSWSIGIELDNPGHSHGYKPFPNRQIATLLDLLTHLCKIHEIAHYAILGHSDIAFDRKQDPGELFPWSTLNTHGFGLIPSREPLRQIPKDEAEASVILEKIGYGKGDFSALLFAFQRHFVPHCLTGILDLETADVLSRIPYLTFFS